MKGLLTTSKDNWAAKEDKNSKYFLNNKRRNFIKQTLRQNLSSKMAENHGAEQGYKPRLPPSKVRPLDITDNVI